MPLKAWTPLSIRSLFSVTCELAAGRGGDRRRVRRRERRVDFRSAQDQERAAADQEPRGGENMHLEISSSCFHSLQLLGIGCICWSRIAFFQIRSPPCCFVVSQEPEWDVSCAFVANAASSIKLKVLKSRTAQNKENESRGAQCKNCASAAQGIQMFEQGQYNQAVDMFTEAMSWDPNDHRFYGNRSYCYWCLEQYSSALTDAQRSIQLAPHWPKGHFRKGCALMGLKRYSEAEQAMEQVLRLDPSCREASSKLFACRVLQLVVRSFTLHMKPESHLSDIFPSSSTLLPCRGCRSLWVGNVNVEVTEQDLKDLFRWFGEIECVRVLHERFCAFVDFKNANMAAKALEKLQGAELKSSKLVMRYPDRWTQRTPPSTQQTTSTSPSHRSRRKLADFGDECFHWRTTGCF
uniref:RRM domain-containing protein n=1 Tax=Salarias fasciatus TaxID=181472 RepID=A0A672FQ81_SALFA